MTTDGAATDPAADPAADPTAEAAPGRWPHPLRSVGAGLAFLVAAVAIQLLRQPGEPTWNTIWAEDGRNFAGDALRLPAAQTLFRGYADYTQFTSRVIALGTRLVPIEAFAAYFAVSAALVGALLGLIVVRSARTIVRSPYLRWSLGLMVVAAPVVFSEVNTAVTNLGWPFLIAGFWAIASLEEGRIDTPVRAATVLLGALSTATQVVLLPWAVLVAVRRRRRSDLIVLGSLLLGLAVQGITMLGADRQPSDSTRDGVDLVELFGLRVLGSLVAGERWIAHLSREQIVQVGLGSLAVLLLIVVLSRPGRLDVDRRILVITAVLTAMVTYGVTVWIRGTSSVALSAPVGAIMSGGRYGYFPVLLLFSALVVVVDDASERPWLQALVLVPALAVLASSLWLTNPRSDGPPWDETVRAARVECRADPTLVEVQLPISPKPAWWVAISCDRLR